MNFTQYKNNRKLLHDKQKKTETVIQLLKVYNNQINRYIIWIQFASIAFYYQTHSSNLYIVTLTLSVIVHYYKLYYISTIFYYKNE